MTDHRPPPNQAQEQAIQQIHGPLLILAGAGTGKTRVIVEKVGYLLQHVDGLRPENILALTFSDKAADEMKQRAAARFGEAARRCRFSTFHSFCYQLLLEQGPWKTLDEIDHWIFLRRNLEKLELDRYLHVAEPGRFLSDLLEFCSRCQDNLVTPGKYAGYVEELAAGLLDIASSPSDAQGRKKAKPKMSLEEQIARQREVARVFARSEELQQQHRLVSFGAMISRAVALLEASPDVLKALRRRYRFILVDEFQDTNWAQIELLRLLAGRSRNVAVVGDPNQAIYHFRGASYTSFKLFEETFPSPKKVELADNYRSTRQILAVAKAAISFSPADPSQPPTQPLRPSKLNPEGRNVEVWEFISEAEQAEFLAREIARRVQAKEAKSYSDIAVLYRNHRHRNRLVAALRRHDIPFSIRKLAINNLSVVRDMVACLRAIGIPADSVSLLRLMMNSRWNLGPALRVELCRAARSHQIALSGLVEQESSEGGEAISAADLQALAPLREFLIRCREIARDQRISEWLDALRQEMALFQHPQEQPAWKAFSEFVLHWEKEKSATGLLGEFLEYFAYFEEAGGTINLPDEDAEAPEQGTGNREQGTEATAKSREDAPLQQTGSREPGTENSEQFPLFPVPCSLFPSPGKVQLMTMHAAKGLEFEHVFLLHLLRGALPSRRQSPLIEFPIALLRGPAPHKDVHTEEERRLFYVALTRAKTTLTLCTISNQKQSPSPFLEQLRDSNCPDLEWKQCSPCGAPDGAPIAAPAILAGATPAGDLILSASGLETYLECPLKYYYSHVCQVPVLPSPALRFGSIMHSAIKQVVGYMARQPEKMRDGIIEIVLREYWAEGGFADPVQERKYWAMGLEQLEGLRRDWAAKPFQLLSQEKTFQFFRGGIRIVGRIDQINALAGKDVELIEYKTGRVQTQKEADNSLQLTLYGLACREVLHLEPVAMVLYNLQTQESLRTKRSKDDFRDLEDRLDAAGRNIMARRFPPMPGYHCKFCDYRAVCPAHDDFS